MRVVDPSSQLTAGPGNVTGHDGSSIRLRPLVGAWAAVLLLHTLVIATGLVSHHAATLISDLVWTVAASLAAISSFRAAMPLTGRDRAAWLAFAFACTAWTAGQLVWNVYEFHLGVTAPFPSYADIGYMAFGPLMLVGLFLLRAPQEERRLTWLRLINLGLVLCSLAIVLLNAFTGPFGEPERSIPSSLVVVSEKASITLAFIVAIYCLWSYRWGERLLSYTLITLSLGVHMVSGLLYARELIIDDYGATSLFNVGWTLAFALHQWAAETQVGVNRRKGEDVARVRQSQGWVEALIPSSLLICIAVTAALLAEEITARTIHLGTIVLVAFAAVLALREAWLYSRGQQLRGALDSSEQALARARQQLNEVHVQRGELERVVEVTARAGGVGLWEWELASNKVQFSREWKRQLGYGEREIGDDFNEWKKRLHPEDFDRVTGALAAFLRNPIGEFICEQRLRHRDGSYRWILAQGCVVLDAAGRPVRMLGSHVDITPFKELEQSLRDSETRYRDLVDALESRVVQRTRELTEAYRESRNFAYAVAHDLKAPLRAINGFCALLEQSAADRLTETERAYIDRATQGANRMSKLIDDLLNYSRVEHREQRLGAIDCKDYVEGLLRSMAHAIEEAGAEVRVNLHRTPVLADREGLRVVLSNLVENALKFSRETQQPRIVIESSVEPPRYVLKVRDNGIGFDPAYREKIFEIFNRLHASGYEGTGIGLALVRKAVQRMQGEVWAESVPGEGATFFVALKLVDAAAADAAARDIQAANAADSRHQ